MSDFVVKDKRLFDKDGQLKDDSAQEGQTASSPAEAAPEPPPERRDELKDKAAAKGGRPEEPRGPLPPVNFAGFLIGLASSALMHLGEYSDPSGGAPKIDLPAARQTIDLLGLLECKTKGNLDHEEEELLKHLLYDLRVKYVAAAK